MFGIKWERGFITNGNCFMNEKWIYPLKEETPSAEALREFISGEGGNCAYWKLDEDNNCYSAYT